MKHIFDIDIPESHKPAALVDSMVELAFTMVEIAAEYTAEHGVESFWRELEKPAGKADSAANAFLSAAVMLRQMEKQLTDYGFELKSDKLFNAIRAEIAKH